MRSARSGYDRISDNDNDISDVSDSERSVSVVDSEHPTGLPFHRRAWRAVNGPAVLDDVEQTQASLVKIFHDLYEDAGSHVYSDGYAPTFKLACFFCGVVMTIFGVLGFLVAGGVVNKVINLYEVAVGLLMLMLEGRKKFVVSFDPKLVVFTQFHLITTLTGKGALYVLAGILFTSSKPFTNFIVGLYTITVGVLCIFYAVKGRGRLKKFKENHPMTSTSEEEIRSKFTYFDTDHDDCLTFEEFIHFLYDAGVFLSHNEAEATAARFDLFNYERRIHVEEFMALYKDEPYIHLTETLHTLKSNSNEAPHLVLEKETLKKKNSAKVEMEKAEQLRTSLHAKLEEEEANKLAALQAIRASEETQRRLQAEAVVAAAEAKRLKEIHDDAHAEAETIRSASNESHHIPTQSVTETAQKGESSDEASRTVNGGHETGGGASAAAAASATTASKPAP